jgi:predicted ABC-type ATPase
MQKPTCTIIAGVNGAGKTTFAMRYLPQVIGCKNFANADLIAAGLSPLNPQREAVNASRLFLKEINGYIARKEDFAFETTLSGKIYSHLIQKMLTVNWEVNLFYLWLPTVEMSIERVAERVSHGGHAIPTVDIIRRYPRSIHNLLNVYSSLCSSVYCIDNSTLDMPEIIFVQNKHGRIIENQTRYDALLNGAKT